MSWIDVRWKPSRAKQAAAASRICRRRAAKWASSTLGTADLGEGDAVEGGGGLVAPERLEVSHRGVPGGQVRAQHHPALGEVPGQVRRVEAERPRLAVPADGRVPL